MKKRIAHISISCFYVDNMGYQENILPKKHYQQGHDVKIITRQYSFDANGRYVNRKAGTYINENNIPVLPFIIEVGK